MKKPIIFVFGAPHSMTSMVAKFLLDNGAVTGSEQENELNELIKYPRFEDKKFVDFIRAKRDFKFPKTDEIVEYLNNFPDDKVVMMKAPMAVFWLNEFGPKLNRPVKAVYVLRDVISYTQSCLDRYKDKYDLMKYLYRYSEVYRATFSVEYPTFVLLAERIKYDAEPLLKFCDLTPEEINFSGVKEISVKETSYFKYRVNNFWLKRLFKWLR